MLFTSVPACYVGTAVADTGRHETRILGTQFPGCSGMADVDRGQPRWLGVKHTSETQARHHAQRSPRRGMSGRGQTSGRGGPRSSPIAPLERKGPEVRFGQRVTNPDLQNVTRGPKGDGLCSSDDFVSGLCFGFWFFFFKKKDVTEEYETGFSKGETTSNEVERKAQKPARPTRHGGQDVRCGKVGSRRERERERERCGEPGGGGGGSRSR